MPWAISSVVYKKGGVNNENKLQLYYEKWLQYTIYYSHFSENFVIIILFKPSCSKVIPSCQCGYFNHISSTRRVNI